MKNFYITLFLAAFSAAICASNNPKTLTLDVVVEQYEKRSLVFDRYVLVTRFLTLQLVEVAPLRFCEIDRPSSCFSFSSDSFKTAKTNIRHSFERPIQQIAIGSAVMSVALALFPSFLMYASPRKAAKPMGLLAATPMLLIFAPFAVVTGIALAAEMIRWNNFERFFSRSDQNHFRWKLSLALANEFYEGDLVAQIAVFAPAYPLK